MTSTPSADPPRKPAFSPRPAPGALGRLLSLWQGRTAVRPLVQAEFDLSKVEVVRNDLLDSDLELIPSPARPAPTAKAPAETPSVTTAAPERSGGRWTNIASLLPGIRRGGV